MKRIISIILLLSLFSVASFSQKSVRGDEIEQVNNKYYLKKNNKLFTGTIIEKWNTGSSETAIVDGLKEGAFIQYYENGNLRSFYSYKNNKLNGVSFDLQ